MSVGIASGASLFVCIATALVNPMMATAAFSLGAYFALASLGNSCLAVFRGHGAGWLRGPRGFIFAAALLYSLAGELARLQGSSTLELPSFGAVGGTISAPSAMITEFLACVLIVFDPLLASPLLRWVNAGVQRGDVLTVELGERE